MPGFFVPLWGGFLQVFTPKRFLIPVDNPAIRNENPHKEIRHYTLKPTRKSGMLSSLFNKIASKLFKSSVGVETSRGHVVVLFSEVDQAEAEAIVHGMQGAADAAGVTFGDFKPAEEVVEAVVEATDDAVVEAVTVEVAEEVKAEGNDTDEPSPAESSDSAPEGNSDDS